MTTELAATNGTALSEAVEAAIATNDLSKLSAEQRTEYYRAICTSLGLNWLTQPFSYLTINGKLTLYANRGATDQLRSLRGISTAIVSRDRIDDVYVVTARATDGAGRTDESTGAVTLGTLKGDALANALMKAETKAKRRVTLSICGLGWMDELELETVRGAQTVTLDQPASAGMASEDFVLDMLTLYAQANTDAQLRKVSGQVAEVAATLSERHKEELRTAQRQARERIQAQLVAAD